MKNKTKITISINKEINEKMNVDSINKSKLINKLLIDFLDNSKNFKDFIK